MNPAKRATGYREIPRHRGTRRDADRIETTSKLRHGHVRSHLDARAKDHALCAELREPPLERGLFQLEVRNAIPKKTAGARGALEHRDGMSGSPQLLRRCQPGRP